LQQLLVAAAMLQASFSEEDRGPRGL
jgi:hypothetical protein